MTNVPPAHERPGIPPGRVVELPGRGATWVRETAAPPGAPALLLLHGWVATAALNWYSVFEPLGRHYRVIAVDHRGHGRGVRPRGRFRLSDCADDAAVLLDVLGVSRAIAIGYSMGGPVAQLLWRRHRSRVAGLVLCATSRNFRGQARPGLGDAVLPTMLPGLVIGTRLVPSVVRRRMARRFLETRIRNPAALEWVLAEVAGHDPGAILEAGREIRTFDSSRWIGEVDVPTAVVVMTRDALVSPRAQQKLAASIPDTTVHPIDADHGACAYRPREFATALLEACASVTARARTRAAV